jgi:hypothetical protein
MKKKLLLALALAASFAAQSQTLRIGLAEDPDVLDPTLARSFVGRIVFSALCDKLFDIDEKLNPVPQLATSFQWAADNKSMTIKLRSGVTFHDGEKFDANAVKFNIERHKNLAGSNRRGELAQSMYSDMYSIRISNPDSESSHWQYLQHNRLKKVLLVPQPLGKYFLGELDMLIRKTNNKDFVRHVHKDMDNLTLQMLANNIESTPENREQYLNTIMIQDPEPMFDYDLIIPYERLFTDIGWVQHQIKTVFGIDIDTPWLTNFQREYETYHQPA